MNEEFINIIETICQRNTLSSDDIPAIDLYMDQIMTLFDQNLSDNKRNDDDKLLTKTMINNYSKAGILKPLKGKKYTREHILQMIIIYYLKNTISITEIKKLLEPYHDQSIEPVYDKFLEQKQLIANACAETIKDYIRLNDMDLNNKQDLMVSILLMCDISNQFKAITEKMLDEYYK